MLYDSGKHDLIMMFYDLKGPLTMLYDLDEQISIFSMIR